MLCLPHEWDTTVFKEKQQSAVVASALGTGSASLMWLCLCLFLLSHIAASLPRGCRASLLHCLCTLWRTSSLLVSFLWDALCWLTSLFSLQLFSVSLRRDTPLTYPVRGHSSLHTQSTTYFSLSSCHSHNLIFSCVVNWAIISFQISCKHFEHAKDHAQVCGVFFVLLFVLFWQSFVFLVCLNLATEAWICQRQQLLLTWN